MKTATAFSLFIYRHENRWQKSLLAFWNQEISALKFRSVRKAVHSAMSKIFCDRIRSLRERAGMTQRDLAIALGREHGMVARIELGERRVDVIEAFELFKALKAEPERELARLMKVFADVQP